jgi:hypothetical protein
VACDVFHGTADLALPSIALEGLLPREEMEKRGRRITYPDYTKPGVVYAVDSEQSARLWASAPVRVSNYEAERVVLCLDIVSDDLLSFDRNFGDEGYEGSATCYELRPLPPERIRVHVGDRCIPISEYVKESDIAPENSRGM